MSNTAILELVGLEKRFDATRGMLWWRDVATTRAVDRINLSLNPGETLGLVGESGSGKSTVAKLILHLMEKSGGDILFNGRALDPDRTADMAWLRRNVQIVFQDPFASLNPRMTVGASITEALTVFGIGSPKERRARARALMAEVGLDPAYATRYPHEFSGGQRQRIGIARALAMDPAILVLDEAVSALDVSVQAQVVNLLRDLQDRHGLSYLFISHDLSITRHISDRIAVMYLGRIVEVGPTDAVFDTPSHPYTQALIQAIPDAHSEPRDLVPLAGEIPSPMNIPQGCRFSTRCPKATARCHAEDPTAQVMTASDHVAFCHFPEA